MNQPSAYHLQGDMLRVLLAGLGCRAAWLPLDDRLLDRDTAIRQLAILVQSGAVQNDGSSLQIELPLRIWLAAIADAPWAVRFFAPGAFYFQGCLYPADGQAVCLLASGAEQLRLCALPRTGLWQALCELEPALDLPDAPPGALGAPLPVSAEHIPLPGEALRLQRYKAGGGGPEQAAAVYGPGYYLFGAGAGLQASPWRAADAQALLEHWLWREKP